MLPIDSGLLEKVYAIESFKTKEFGTASSSSSSKWGPVPFKVHVYFSHQTEPIKIPALSTTVQHHESTTTILYIKKSSKQLCIFVLAPMASVELEETPSETVLKVEVSGGGGSKTSEKSKKKKKKTKKEKKDKNGAYRYYMSKLGFGCVRLRTEYDKEGNFDMEVVDEDGQRRNPTHLVIMVNGLIGK